MYARPGFTRNLVQGSVDVYDSIPEGTAADDLIEDASQDDDGHRSTGGQRGERGGGGGGGRGSASMHARPGLTRNFVQGSVDVYDSIPEGTAADDLVEEASQDDDGHRGSEHPCQFQQGISEEDPLYLEDACTCQPCRNSQRCSRLSSIRSLQPVLEWPKHDLEIILHDPPHMSGLKLHVAATLSTELPSLSIHLLPGA